MTTATDIQALARRYADLKDALDEGYANLKALEYELRTALRAEYAAEWEAWERGLRKFQAEGVTIELKRQYDANAVLAEFGEEFPDLVTTETQVVTKVDGRAAAKLWKDAAMARRLEKCLIPQTPRLSVPLATEGK